MEVPEDLLHCARALRGSQTDAETLLWHLLRNRRFCGYKFRRQHPIGRYIVDFYCHEAMLVIELDGGGHGYAEQAAYDEERTKELEGTGLKVLRFWNHELLQNTDIVLEAILASLQDRYPHPALRATLSQRARVTSSRISALIPLTWGEGPVVRA